MDSITHIREIYKTIKSSKAKYGVYRKTLFHLHTPASHDYRLLSKWDEDTYKKCSEDVILSECYKQGVLPKAFARENLIFGGELAKTYDSKQEWLSYLLVAGKLFQNKYEVVLISDHNSLKGFDKLQRAVEDYNSTYHKGDKDAVYPELISGVEVSCADKFHVVGIFDKADRETVEQWLNENAWKYGFVQRYASDKTDITGVLNEPWHYRYVGKKAAEVMTEKNLCLEEYLNEM